MKRATILLLLLLGPWLTACEDFLDITPRGMVIPESPEDYRALLTNIYSSFPKDLPKLELRTDDVDIQNFRDETNRNTYFDLYTWNDGSQALSSARCLWKDYYHVIFVANYLIENVGQDPRFAQEVGEAYLLRAYSYFLLANIYGLPWSTAHRDSPCVPLVLDTRVEVERGRAPLGEVYEAIIQDATQGRDLMTQARWPESHSYRFSRDAATALLMRIALYTENWAAVIQHGEELLDAGYELIEGITSSKGKNPLLYNSSESIMSLDFPLTEALLDFIRTSPSLNALLRTGDRRRTAYLSSPELNVYQPRREAKALYQYRSTFRLAEVYLSLAEAHTRREELDQAKALILKLGATRRDATLLTTFTQELEAATSQDEVLRIVLDERRLELAFSGLRWFDLRRLDQPAITHSYQGQDYVLNPNDTRYTLPIPREARTNNSNL